jgi:hypothetical protein
MAIIGTFWIVTLKGLSIAPESAQRSMPQPPGSLELALTKPVVLLF